MPTSGCQPPCGVSRMPTRGPSARRPAGLVFAWVLLAGAHIAASAQTAAPLTFADVRPILTAHCGACHGPDGPGVLLLDPVAAAAAAPAIREQVLREAMPPWFADPTGPAVAGARTLTARELDTLLTWASGNRTPGPSAPPPEPRRVPDAWPGGEPSHVIALPAIVVSAAGTTPRITVTPSLPEEIWVQAVDVRSPGRSGLISAEVRVAGGPLLGIWFAGEPTVAARDGTAFRIPAGAALTVDLRFVPGADSRALSAGDIHLGLHTAAPGVRALAARPVGETLTLDAAVQVLALRVAPEEPLDVVEVVATRPGGATETLLRLRTVQPGWARRYWLAEPVSLPAGTHVSVHVSGENPAVEVLLVDP